MTDRDPRDLLDLSTFPAAEPIPPSSDYVDQLEAQTRTAMRTRRHAGSEHTGAPAQLHDALEAEVEAVHGELVELMLDLYEHPEVAFAEVRSSRAIVEVLRKHGIEAELGAHGVETAIRAEIRGAAASDAEGATGAESDAAAAPGAPTLAVLSEYDALPVVGHGCGHNVIAVMGLGAFLALAALAKKDPSAVPGRIVYLGTPAEEGHSGKEVMAAGGAWDDIDMAVMAHPFSHDVADTAWLGRRTLTVEFHGRTAHASAQPFMGRNALDAASLMYQGIGLLRQQIPPSDRVHAVIREGGDRASVIPDLARLDLYVRSLAPETLRDLSRRIEDVARGAALMTSCGVTVTWDKQPPSLPVRTNTTLTGRWVEAQRRRGRDPLPRGVVSETLAASTDFGNVSFRLPGIHPMIRIADPDTALHTREFAKAATSDLARSAAADGAYGLAATLLDVLHDPALSKAVTEEFEEAGGAIDVPGYFD
ncbi:amidohydrolase [Brachybacterium sp. p3-SID1565]|uniref:Amidohydrolase n=1 Tax=Brachybacterium epidermidis TaxID=2781983 RepID=A0ABR9W0I3_9MICO|nr:MULTISPECIES: M20 family metallopeptidase [Brachybacterium]MBE9403934.1 amidohydrolase [Brachybacterium epidermidis]MCT1385474.1 amidohydrolase [Brachybacterium sp. p3-SID1565]MCT1775452.1 amidohydrolase [Brachybacterium sp. p3-SID957]